MVPFKRFSFEGNGAENNKNNQRDDLLNNFQLDQAERATIVAETDAVGRNLKTIFKECQEPAEKDNTQQRKMFEPTELH